MGLMAVVPVLALYVKERFAIEDPAELAFWAGIIYGVAPLCAAIAGPMWGGLGDRIGKKPMAIRANLAIAATTALMPLAPTPLLLLIMRAVQGLFAGYVAPAMALATAEAPRSAHGLVIARLQVAMAVGSVLGPVIGPIATQAAGRESLFWLTSVFAAASALWLHLRAEETRSTQPRPAFLRELLQSSRLLLTNHVFAWLLLLVLLLRLGQNMLEPFVVLFVHELGAPAWLAVFEPTPTMALDLTAGIAFSVLAVAQIVFTISWGRLADRFGPLRCLSALGIALSSLLLLTAGVTSIDQFLVLRSLAGCVMAGSMALAYAAASKRVADEQRTLAFSLVQSCMQLGFALGPMLGAWFAVAGTGEHANYRRAFAAAAGLCFVAGIGMLLLRRLSTRRGAAL